MINATKIWLFETSVNDPYFFGEKDGIEVTMQDQDTIALLSINTVVYRMTSAVHGSFGFTPRYGGDAVAPSSFYGQAQYEYELQFNLPLLGKVDNDRFWGKQYSVLYQSYNDIYVIFASFDAQPLTIDNEYIQRITLRTQRTTAKRFKVQSLNITSIINDIDGFEPTELIPPLIQSTFISSVSGSLQGVSYTEGQLVASDQGGVNYFLDPNTKNLTIISDDAVSYGVNNNKELTYTE